jgi:hypothetical protein
VWNSFLTSLYNSGRWFSCFSSIITITIPRFLLRRNPFFHVLHVPMLLLDVFLVRCASVHAFMFPFVLCSPVLGQFARLGSITIVHGTSSCTYVVVC